MKLNQEIRWWWGGKKATVLFTIDLHYSSALTYTEKSPHVLEIHWSYLHLSSFSRVAATFPRAPVNTIMIRWVLSVIVEAIKTRGHTVVKPPSSFVAHGTVAWVFIIVAIFGCKRGSSVITQRISSSSWKNLCITVLNRLNAILE